MALERKRAFYELLVRGPMPDQGAPGGVHVRMRSWIEDDGVPIPGTENIDDPTPAELGTAEVQEALGEALALTMQQTQVREATVATRDAELVELRAHAAALEAQVEGLTAALEEAQDRCAALEARERAAEVGEPVA